MIPNLINGESQPTPAASIATVPASTILPPHAHYLFVAAAAQPGLVALANQTYGTGITDEAGQYRIPDLPPGTYKISFTLPSFATVVREGVELTGAGVATIGAEMRVGSVAESVTGSVSATNPAASI